MTRYDPTRGNRVPLARAELKKIASELAKYGPGFEPYSEWINDIVEELMIRKSPNKPVARARQAKITATLVYNVLNYFKEHPHMHNRDIGRVFGIDGGRVSEMLQGYRTVAYPQGTPEWKKR